MTNLSNKHLIPVIAVIVGASGAWLARSTPSTGTATVSPLASETIAKSDRVQPRLPGNTKRTNSIDLRGKVLEIIEVPNYTYLRIELQESIAQQEDRNVWAAVSKATVTVGQAVTIADAQRMDEFKSSTLKRTFDVIYFGVLANESTKATALPAGHPDIENNDGTLKDRSEPTEAFDANNADVPKMHGSPTAGGDAIPVGNVERAPGKLGHTVAELVRGRKDFAGQTVRVRGVVVKSTSGVLGKSFVHLRDGSGSAVAKDHDLTITLEQEIAVGSRFTFEGIVVTDKDFGAGYIYPILLENARTVNE